MDGSMLLCQALRCCEVVIGLTAKVYVEQPTGQMHSPCSQCLAQKQQCRKFLQALSTWAGRRATILCSATDCLKHNCNEMLLQSCVAACCLVIYIPAEAPIILKPRLYSTSVLRSKSAEIPLVSPNWKGMADVYHLGLPRFEEISSYIFQCLLTESNFSLHNRAPLFYAFVLMSNEKPNAFSSLQCHHYLLSHLQINQIHPQNASSSSSVAQSSSNSHI